jgi:hypothetical protein
MSTKVKHPITIWIWFSLCVLAVLCGNAVSVLAQFQMPDPKQMSGIPRPVDDLPAGSISVRLIRGSLSNNIAGHPVELRIAGKAQTVKTDDAGRAQFDKVPAGATVKASADVDGEHLESQEFTAPAQGGIRLMLVATDTTKGPATDPGAAAVSGQVTISDQSRIVLEPADEALNVFYLIDINNPARVPVNATPPFTFDVPKAALGAGIMQGSSPQAAYANGQVRVSGPIAPGHTFVQVAYALPVSSGEVDVAQTFPANIDALAVVAKKVGDVALSSPLLASQRDMPADGEMFIAAMGGPVAAGRPVTLTLSGLPHHSNAPRAVALALALGIALVGAWSARAKPDGSAGALDRKRLLGKRDKLMNDLVRIEGDHKSGRGPYSDPQRYAVKREEIVVALETLYGTLDNADAGVELAP